MEINTKTEVCSRCGGWLDEDIQTGDMYCDTCGRKILVSNGEIDDSDCED